MTRLPADYLRLIRVMEAGNTRLADIAREYHMGEPGTSDMLRILRRAGIVVRLPDATYHVWNKPDAKELERMIWTKKPYITTIIGTRKWETQVIYAFSLEEAIGKAVKKFSEEHPAEPVSAQGAFELRFVEGKEE